MTELEIVDVGWSTTVQDGGRPGYASIGVPPSGALDAATHRRLNRLLGNPERATVLETAGRLRVRASGPCVVATSAESAARAVETGEEITVDPAPEHLWAYLAVRGGLAVAPVLGSASHDTLSGLGPPALAPGQRLAVGPDPGTPIVTDLATVALGPDQVPVWPGPRADWFAPGALERFASATWTVSAEVSRVGVRLDGPPIERAVEGELPSEGLVTGAVQVPPDGRPVVMLADHPTTGGYPVLAVVDPDGIGTVVRTRPGGQLRFRLEG